MTRADLLALARERDALRADRDHYRTLALRLADRLADASEALSATAERGRAERFARLRAELLAAMDQDIEQLRRIVRGATCP